MNPKLGFAAVLIAGGLLAGIARSQSSPSWNAGTFTGKAKDAAAASNAATAQASAPERPPGAPVAAPLSGEGAARPASAPPVQSPIGVDAEGKVLSEQARGTLASMRQDEEESLSDESGLSYSPGSRRDPFKPLIGGNTGVDDDKHGTIPGLPGIEWNSLQLIGIVETGGERIAVFFGGPENKAYFAREGMSFYDGSLHSIDPIGKLVKIRTKVENPNPLFPYRDQVVKLHPDEDLEKQ